MIRHQIYFDTLGSMQEDSDSWRCVFAGLSVLRLVDSYAEVRPGTKPGGWAQIHSVRTAIEEMGEGNPMRGVLTAVLDEVTSRNAIDDVVCRTLMSYGRVLDYEASWSLAIDVFGTVVGVTKPERNARLAVEAYVALGGAGRRNGDWDTAARAYSHAAYIADTLGDRPGVLTVQVGIANTYLAKGNLPQAQSILDDVIIQAQDQELSEVQAIALHSRAALAARRGDHADGLRLAYEALCLTSKSFEKDLVLGDIGGMFTQIGMLEPARDAHLVLAATSQSKFVRWSATLNLMELASLDEMPDVFDEYARELAGMPLGPWLRSHYLLFLGEGMQRFGRIDAAIDALEEAVRFSKLNQIYQIAFKAQDALVHVRSIPTRAAPPFVPSRAWVPNDVSTIVEAMSNLRSAALAAT